MSARIEIESEHSLPIVHFQLLFAGGAATDPAGEEGLARLAARLMRRGTKTRDAGAIEEAIDSLGAELGIETGMGFVRVSGSVIRESAEAMLALVGEILREPALREQEFSQLKRETQAALTETLDNDGALAGAQFRRMVFGDHPFARNVAGSRESVARCSLERARAYHARFIAPGPAVVGFAGDVREDEARRWTESYLRSEDAPALLDLPEPEAGEGRRLCIVDKPARSQTQLYIGCLGSSAHDHDHHALVIGNAVFGGTFTSRLTREVRSERGWSYGASSRLGIDKVRDCWSMWTHPALEDAADCVALQVELMETWVREGVDRDEVEFAKSYLVKSHAFSVDTAEKRLDQRLEQALLDLPEDYYDRYLEHLSRVEVDDVNRALRARLDPSRLSISILATASELEGALRERVDVDALTVRPFDRDV